MIKRILDRLQIPALNEMQHAAVRSAISNDIMLLSPTGSGKTLAFLIPVLSGLDAGSHTVQAVILVPSRELALQIGQVFKAMDTGFKISCCYGGHSVKTEKNNLVQPPAVLIGTPGRLAFHLRQENFDPAFVKTLVLDEFDKALESGFEDDMSFIISRLENVSRRILTSATRMEKVPGFTGLKDHAEVNFLNDQAIVPDPEIRLVFSGAEDKLETLFSLICKIGNKAALIFCNHRDAVDRISSTLAKTGLDHGIFHGGMDQDEREKALLRFRNGTCHLLITTDLASRGLDIPEIEYVIHYQLPHLEEAFLHRNGRTARMHSKGTVYVILTPGESLQYLGDDVPVEELPGYPGLPGSTPWSTLYIGGGKKEKIRKADIAGLLLQKGGLSVEELGLIEVHDHSSYAAVSRDKIGHLVRLLKKEKLKNRRIKIEISR